MNAFSSDRKSGIQPLRYVVALALGLAVAPAFAESASGLPDSCTGGACGGHQTLAKVTDRHGRSADSLHAAVESQISPLACSQSDSVAAVYVDIASRLRDVTRRAGDATTYFMPASWSRPPAVCSGVATPQLPQKKLG